MAFYVYILAEKRNTKFILGFTNNLVGTIHEMRFPQEPEEKKQPIKKLVYFERHTDYEEAKRRERELMMWDASYMKTIVSLQNSKYNDLYEVIF